MAQCEKTLGGALLFLGDALYNPGAGALNLALHLLQKPWCPAGVFMQKKGSVIDSFSAAHLFSCRCLL